MCDWGGGPNSMANYLPPKPTEIKPTPESNVLICPGCEGDVDPSNNYCPNCGNRVGVTS